MLKISPNSSFYQISSKDSFMADDMRTVVLETKNSKANKANLHNQRMCLNVYRCDYSQTGRKVKFISNGLSYYSIAHP